MLHGEKVEILKVNKRAQIKNMRTGKKEEISLEVLQRTKQ